MHACICHLYIKYSLDLCVMLDYSIEFVYFGKDVPPMCAFNLGSLSIAVVLYNYADVLCVMNIQFV